MHLGQNCRKSIGKLHFLETVLLKLDKFHIFSLMQKGEGNECIPVCIILSSRQLGPFTQHWTWVQWQTLWVLKSLISFSSQAFMSVSKLLIKNKRALPLHKYSKWKKSPEVQWGGTHFPPPLIEMWSMDESNETVTRHSRKIILMKACSRCERARSCALVQPAAPHPAGGPASSSSTPPKQRRWRRSSHSYPLQCCSPHLFTSHPQPFLAARCLQRLSFFSLVSLTCRQSWAEIQEAELRGGAAADLDKKKNRLKCILGHRGLEVRVTSTWMSPL